MAITPRPAGRDTHGQPLWRLRGWVTALAVLAVSIILTPNRLSAAELLMFDEPGCIWCQRWHQAIGPIYPRSAEGQQAPLRVLQRRARVPAEYRLKASVVMTPTFVLVDDRGREVDRITGYPPPEFFWSLLGEMLAKLPARPSNQPAVRQISTRR